MYISHPSLPPIEEAYHILSTTKSAYPAIVLGVFLLSFIIHGVLSAPRDDGKVAIQAKRGPGGRPLPMRRKSASQVKEAAEVSDFSPNAKMVFRALTGALLATFAANAIIVIVQCLLHRKEQWWPGQAAVVSLGSPHNITCS